MRSDEGFQWGSVDVGNKIENFLLLLCEYVPSIVYDLLAVGFGSLSHWYTNEEGDALDTWQMATCGCLVGQAALSGLKLVTGACELVETHQDNKVNNSAIVVLYMAICAATKRQMHKYPLPHKDIMLMSNTELKKLDPLLIEIYEVGMAVANQGTYSSSDSDVGQFMLDFMRVVMTDMGYTKLPKSLK